jgi:thiamine biosynthesis lipoprotein
VVGVRFLTVIAALTACQSGPGRSPPPQSPPASASAESAAAPVADPAPATTTRQRYLMSTFVTVTVAAAESKPVVAAIDAAFAEVGRLDLLLSEWKEGSQVAEVNRQAGTKAVAIGDELYGVIRAAHDLSRASNGAFDVTIGALWGAWDFEWRRPKVPTPAELRPRVAVIDYRKLELDDAKKTARLAEEGMKISLGGIAKGYIVDRASKVLRGRGFSNHLVVAGGDLYAAGRKGDRRWRIGVRHPGEKRIYGTIELENEAMATSGNYERFFIKGGVRYHHILDPKTGQPARGLASVTTVAPTCLLADGYSTALFVLGEKRGLALAERTQGVDALLFRDESFDVVTTGGLGDRVKPLGKPGASASDEHDGPAWR